MMISMKKTLLTIAGLLLVSGGLVFAQAVAGIPITKAPNADPTLPMYTLPDGSSMIKYDGQIISDGLSVNKTSAPTANYLLDVVSGLEIIRDYPKERTFNCFAPDYIGSNGSNKCYGRYKLLKTGAVRDKYPEFISLSAVNSSTTGGVVVLGKTTNSAVTDSSQTFPLTPGAKLDINGTNLALQGDPAAAYMNQGSSAGVIYPGASCANPNSPNCKKYACIENEPGTDVTKQQGNIVTCTTATAVATVSPARPVCSDGIDNDNDGTIDGADPQCFCSNGQYRQLWTSESSAPNTSNSLFWAGCSNININNLGPATGTAGNALTPTGGSGSSAVGLPSGGFTGSSSLAN